MKMRTNLLLVAALLSAACGGEGRPSGQPEDAPPPGRSGRMPEAMRMPSMEQMPGVRAYLDTIASAEPEDLTRLAEAHRARIAPMLEAMDQDMKAMNMTADEPWQTLSDSVRADLRAVPELRGQALVLRMRGHAGRMRRLLGMHERMMGHMEM